MKFRAHDTFFIRKGWLNKGMKYILLKPELFIDKSENPMDVLGIGSNMVKSLRYWLQAVGLTVEATSGRRLQNLTELGKCIFKNDRYLEELGTLHLLQYKLATNYDDATAWYYFFNEFNMTEFTKDDFVAGLKNYVALNGDNEVALRSLNDDFNCIINTYLPRFKTSTKKVTPENNIDCPLGELFLVDVIGKERKLYKKSIPSANSFNTWIVLAIITEQAEGRVEVGLNELLTAPCNIGKIFNLDAITMLDILYRVEKTGAIKIIRNAGLDVIHLLDVDKSFQDYVETYYASINV